MSVHKNVAKDFNKKSAFSVLSKSNIGESEEKSDQMRSFVGPNISQMNRKITKAYQMSKQHSIIIEDPVFVRKPSDWIESIVRRRKSIVDQDEEKSKTDRVEINN